MRVLESEDQRRIITYVIFTVSVRITSRSGYTHTGDMRTQALWCAGQHVVQWVNWRVGEIEDSSEFDARGSRERGNSWIVT